MNLKFNTCMYYVVYNNNFTVMEPSSILVNPFVVFVFRAGVISQRADPTILLPYAGKRTSSQNLHNTFFVYSISHQAFLFCVKKY